MKKVFTSHDSAEVGFLQSVLENAGIECSIRHETQAYPSAFQPELWILWDEDLPAAEELCRRWRSQPAAVAEERWRCGVCGEELEGHFDACWKCGTPRGTLTATAPGVPEIKEEAFPGAAKLFEPWLIAALGLLAFGAQLHWSWKYEGNPTAALYYPVETALWLTGRELTLQEGWKDAPEWRQLFKYWHDVRYDVPAFCEYVLRDTLVYARSHDLPHTNIMQLRANLAVLLAETGSWQSSLKELEMLDRGASDFALAMRKVYETNGNASVSGIVDAKALLGDTWFRRRFEARWLRLHSDASEAARIRDSMKAHAQAMYSRHFAVISIATAGQVLGLGALLWLLMARSRLQPAARELAVPWQRWEGLAIFFAASFFSLVLYEIVNASHNGRQFTYYNYNLLVHIPLIGLLWLRYWRRDQTSLKALFSLAPIKGRGLMLIAAGLVLFLVDTVGWRGLKAATEAIGFSPHWAEGMDEAEYYEPWPLRWVVLANALLWAPIGEEMMFRGILFPALRAWMPLTAAALVSAIAFAALHYYSLPAFLGLTLFGFASAILAHRTGSLVPSILGHSLTNAVFVAGPSWVFGGN